MLKNLLLGTVAIVALASGATATFAQDIKEFRIGILGGENEADRLRNYQCLADHLKAEFGFEKVSLFPAADYDGVIQGLLGGTLDVAGLGASGYAKIYLADQAAVVPMFTTQQTDGATGYFSIGFALKSAGLTKITDFKGKKLGYADPDSTSGYLIPLTQMPAETGAANEEFFAETSFGGGHENNMLGMLDGKTDIVAVDSSGIGEWADGYTSGTPHKMVAKGLLDMNDVVEVWRSPLIPNGPTVASTALGADWIKKISDFYMSLPTKDIACFNAIEGGDFTGYVPVEPSFYQPIIDAREAAIGG